MRLSNLYTEESLLEARNPLRDLIRYASKAAGRARNTPNPRKARIEKLIQEVYEEVWGDYHDDPRAIARIDAFKHSMKQFIPQFLKIQGEESIRNEIETLFRDRAERSVAAPALSK